jgi:hypothetical protein
MKLATFNSNNVRQQAPKPLRAARVAEPELPAGTLQACSRR